MTDLAALIPLPQSAEARVLAEALEKWTDLDHFQEMIDAHPALALESFCEQIVFHVLPPGTAEHLAVAHSSFTGVWERMVLHSERLLPPQGPQRNPRLQVAHDVLNDVSIRICVEVLLDLKKAGDFQNFHLHLKALIEHLGRDKIFLEASRDW